MFLAVFSLVSCSAVKAQSPQFRAELKKSTETIKAQRLERTRLNIEQAEKRALEISDQSERHCTSIKEEENKMIGDGRGPAFQFREYRTATTEEIAEARKPYEEQVKEVRTDTERRIREVLDEGHRAADAIEQSAAHVHNGVRELAPNLVQPIKALPR
jgi:hypothetical protein